MLIACEIGYSKIDDKCYFIEDLDFLEILIKGSQSNSNSPSENLNPLDLGYQIWENGRLIEFCSSPKVNTECRTNYTLSGEIPKSTISL